MKCGPYVPESLNACRTDRPLSRDVRSMLELKMWAKSERRSAERIIGLMRMVVESADRPACVNRRSRWWLDVKREGCFSFDFRISDGRAVEAAGSGPIDRSISK